MFGLASCRDPYGAVRIQVRLKRLPLNVVARTGLRQVVNVAALDASTRTLVCIATIIRKTCSRLEEVNLLQDSKNSSSDEQ